MKTYQSYSSEETELFGKNLAKKFLKRETRNVKRKRALILALSGELGSGKTTFVQGFLRGLGIRKRSPSPTFIIFRRFTLSILRSRATAKDRHVSGFKNLYHVDAYRIWKPRELLTLGFKEILNNPNNVVVIEWAEKVKRLLPKDASWLLFLHGKKVDERVIRNI